MPRQEFQEAGQAFLLFRGVGRSRTEIESYLPPAPSPFIKNPTSYFREGQARTMKRRWGCSCVSTTSLKERELFPLFVFHARHTSSVRRGRSTKAKLYTINQLFFFIKMSAAAPAWRWREISDQKAFLTKVGEKLGVKEVKFIRYF